MKPDSNLLVQEALALWKRRDHLSTQEWATLHARLCEVCVRDEQRERSRPGPEVFDRFFLRRVVESTPSDLPSLSCAGVFFEWFVDSETRSESPASAFAQLESMTAVVRRPPLAATEESIFRPSDALCIDIARKVVSGADDAGSGGDADLAARAGQMADAMRQADIALSGTECTMTAELTAYLQRKSAATQWSFSQLPATGQLVRIDALTGPAGRMDEDLARPLWALIDGPTDVDDVWWGWMVGAEADYACEWDFVLEDSEVPMDPMAASVQLWNPVRIYLPTVARVLGELPPERVAALRSLVADFLSGTELADARTGGAARADTLLVGRTTSAGHDVLTGPVLGGPTDVRHVYQTLYEGAADALQQPARMAAVMMGSAAWLPAASVMQTGVNRFVATAAHDPELSVEVEFQFPGIGQAVTLMQRRGRGRHDAALVVAGHRIEFRGGVAVPDADAAAGVATEMRLPEAYVGWAETSGEFARSGRTTTGRLRRAMQDIQAAALSAARSPAEVFRFLFVPYADVRSRADANVPASVVVSEVRLTGPGSGRVHLWWHGAPPKIDHVELLLRGKPIEARLQLKWEQGLDAVEFIGTSIDPDAAATASVSGSTLRIDLSPIDLPR